MSVIGSFTGADQKRDLTAAKGRADTALKTGFDAGQADYDNAFHQFDQYAGTGGRANAMYADATGVNGQPAYDAAAHNFTTGDPFRQSNEDFANEQLKRTFAARGGLYSGNAMLAAARGSLERGSTDWNNWLNRLQGQAGQGFQAAGAQAGINVGKGDMAMGYGQTQAGNEINFGNAMASNRGTLMNNLTGLAGVGIKAFTPGWGGATPAGNAMKAFS
jgi:hypothetical protein